MSEHCVLRVLSYYYTLVDTKLLAHLLEVIKCEIIDLELSYKNTQNKGEEHSECKAIKVGTKQKLSLSFYPLYHDICQIEMVSEKKNKM